MPFSSHSSIFPTGFPHGFVVMVLVKCFNLKKIIDLNSLKYINCSVTIEFWCSESRRYCWTMSGKIKKIIYFQCSWCESLFFLLQNEVKLFLDEQCSIKEKISIIFHTSQKYQTQNISHSETKKSGAEWRGLSPVKFFIFLKPNSLVFQHKMLIKYTTTRQ